MTPRPFEPAWPPKAPRRLRRVGPSVEQFVEGNAVSLFEEGLATFEAMLADIEAAQRFVWLEMYWFSADSVGRRFFAALQGAASRGVEVRVMFDSVGSFGTDWLHFERLRDAGASVVEFNPLSPLQMRFHLARLTVRNHRKLLIVDGQHAFVGGLNIADEWLPREQGGQAWRDDVVRLSGPVVRGLCESFVGSWLEACDVKLPLPPAPEAAGSVRAAVLDQSGLRRRRALNAYLMHIWQAKHTISISNAYFMPNGRLRRALIAAARRGVTVKILLPGTSDVPLIRHASRGIWEPLLRVGVRIFEWQPSVLHSKTAVVDAQWVTIGSFNLDYISILNNRELNVSVLDEPFARRIEASFQRDLSSSIEVDAAEFSRRPWVARGFERVLYWFRAWL